MSKASRIHAERRVEDQMVEAAAQAAEQGAVGQVPGVTVPLPAPGQVQGAIQVQGVSDAAGKPWVRVVWVSAGALTVIDLPSDIARKFATGIEEAAGRAASGLVVPSGVVV